MKFKFRRPVIRGKYFPHYFVADVLIYSTLGFIIYAIVR